MEKFYFVEEAFSQKQLRKIEDKLKADFKECRVVCISAEILFEDVIWYIKDGIESEWIRKYENVDILFVSDLQYFIWENTRIQKKLLQFLENMIGNKQVILTSTKPIEQLEGLSTEMKELLCCAEKVDIGDVVPIENDKMEEKNITYVEDMDLDEAAKLELKILEDLCRKSWRTFKKEIVKTGNESQIYLETFIEPLEVKKIVKMREKILVILEKDNFTEIASNFVENHYGRLIEMYIGQEIGKEVRVKVWRSSEEG